MTFGSQVRLVVVLPGGGKRVLGFRDVGSAVGFARRVGGLLGVLEGWYDLGGTLLSLVPFCALGGRRHASRRVGGW